jgi:hypothetical protein
LRFAVAFTLLAIALVGLACSSAGQGGWWISAIELYISLGLFTLAVAYGMKQAGFPVEEVCCRPRWAFAAGILLAPYRVLGRLTLGLTRRIDREAGLSEVAPGLFIGRRPSRSERRRLAGAGIEAVLDLCAEFPHPDWAPERLDSEYIPILDGSAPSDRQFRSAMGWIEVRREEGKTILIHCAQGHGRSATVAAVALCRLGLASGLDRAIEQIRSARPRARPSREQRSAAVGFLGSIERERNAKGRAISPAPSPESRPHPDLSGDR